MVAVNAILVSLSYSNINLCIISLFLKSIYLFNILVAITCNSCSEQDRVVDCFTVDIYTSMYFGSNSFRSKLLKVYHRDVRSSFVPDDDGNLRLMVVW